MFRVNYVLNRLLIAFTHTQNSAQTNIKQISPGRTSHSIPLVSLKSIVLNLKDGLTFSCFSPPPSCHPFEQTKGNSFIA